MEKNCSTWKLLFHRQCLRCLQQLGCMLQTFSGSWLRKELLRELKSCRICNVKLWSTQVMKTNNCSFSFHNSSMCIWIVERILSLAQNSETFIWEHHHHHHWRLHSTCDFVIQRQSESMLGILWRHINKSFIWPNFKQIFSLFLICCPFPLLTLTIDRNLHSQWAWNLPR